MARLSLRYPANFLDRARWTVHESIIIGISVLRPQFFLPCLLSVITSLSFQFVQKPSYCHAFTQIGLPVDLIFLPFATSSTYAKAKSSSQKRSCLINQPISISIEKRTKNPSQWFGVSQQQHARKASPKSTPQRTLNSQPVSECLKANLLPSTSSR
jgi:hypothetical protein